MLQGLGKTVQVMALIAHLMEKKGNYGPHLIIVPNAVMVNWKAELTRWLPGVRCIYYVGTREVGHNISETGFCRSHLASGSTAGYYCSRCCHA